MKTNYMTKFISFKQWLAETFSEESDPIHDMGIGITKFWKKERDKEGKTSGEVTSKKYFGTKKWSLESYMAYIVLSRVVDDKLYDIKSRQKIFKSIVRKFHYKGFKYDIKKILYLLNDVWFMQIEYPFEKITESAITPAVNKHMTHAEDMVILSGKEGLDWVINMFKQLHSKLKGNTEHDDIKLSVKFDGAPSVFVWSKFPGMEKSGVAIKALFAKDPKIMYNDNQVDHYYGEQKDLAFKLKMMLKYIPSLGIPEGEIWQGDFLFDKTTLIKEKTYISFHPNTIVYKVPIDSDLGKKVEQADIGVVWHTRYEGESLGEISAKYNTKTGELNENPKVFMTDPYIASMAGIVTLSEAENNYFEKQISALELAAKNFGQSSAYKEIISNTEFTTLFTTFQNSLIRRDVRVKDNEEFLNELQMFINVRFSKEIEAKKTTKAKDALQKKQDEMIVLAASKELRIISSIIMKITTLKNMFVKKLNNINKFETFLKTKEGKYISTGEEGFAVSDIEGNIVKLVDRYEFSFANFSPNIVKGWSK